MKELLTKSRDLLCAKEFSTEELTSNERHNFQISGYSGAILSQGSWKGIIDFEGITAKDNRVAVLREHTRDRIVGHGEVSISPETGVLVTGKFSKTTADAHEVRNLLAEGFSFQASMGIRPLDGFISEGGEIVNNITLPSGIEVWTASRLMEMSICTLGTDEDTSVRTFALEDTSNDERTGMEVKELEPKVLTEADAVKLMADAEVKEEMADVDETIETHDVEPGEEVAEEPVPEDEATVEEESVVEDAPEEAPVEEAEDGEVEPEEDGDKEDITVDPEEGEPAIEEKKELSAAPMMTFSQADLDAAITAERERVVALFAADAPLELTLKAVKDGMDDGAAYRMFYLHEKQLKTDGLKELAAEAVSVELPGNSEAKSLGYLELVDQIKEARGVSQMEAIKLAQAENPEAYSAYLGK